MTEGFGARLQRVFDRAGQLCVGIDPHPSLLSGWGLPDSAAGTRAFGLQVVDAAAGRVGIVKPQIAFYERHGSAGYAALEDVLAAARDASLMVIADVKRGDVGSTMEAYGEAWLTPGSTLEVDAITAVAYQGVGSLTAVLDRAVQYSKGVFVLAATSNADAHGIQSSRGSDGRCVAEVITSELSDRNRAEATGILGPFGVVAGATVQLRDFGLGPESFTGMAVLAPGFGHQGARIGQLDELFGSASSQVLVSASRSILSAGPAGLAKAIDAHRAELPQ